MEARSLPSAGERWAITPGCQWGEWLPWTPYNWRNATLLEVSFEVDHLMGRLELALGFLGLTLRVEYVYDPEPLAKLRSDKDRILASLRGLHPDAEIVDPDGVLDKLDDGQKEGS